MWRWVSRPRRFERTCYLHFEKFQVWTTTVRIPRLRCCEKLQNLHSLGAWTCVISGRWHLTLSWPAGHTCICPTYKESFQARWDNSIPLFLHAAVYLEVSLFRWTNQNAFSRETAVYKWYCVQCCIAALHTVSFVGRWQHGEKWDTVIPADLKRLFVSGTYTYVPLVTKGLSRNAFFVISVLIRIC